MRWAALLLLASGCGAEPYAAELPAYAFAELATPNQDPEECSGEELDQELELPAGCVQECSMGGTYRVELPAFAFAVPSFRIPERGTGAN